MLQGYMNNAWAAVHYFNNGIITSPPISNLVPRVYLALTNSNIDPGEKVLSAMLIGYWNKNTHKTV